MNGMFTPEFGVKLPNILNRLFGTAATYDPIDPELYGWATRHGLHLLTKYKEGEVRSTDVIGTAGNKCQI